MEGELSASVRGLRHKASFAEDVGIGECLTPLVGSLDRLQSVCDEALAAIAPESKTSVAAADSDWKRLLSMKADYEKRLLAEEAFVSAGGEQRFVKKFEDTLSRLELFNHELGELEKCRERLNAANSAAPETSIEELHKLEKELARIENEAKDLYSEAGAWERLSHRIAPSGADMKHWTVLRLKAYGDTLEPKQGEIADSLKWLGHVRKTIEEKRAACCQKEDAWNAVFRAKQAFDAAFFKCGQLGKSAMETRMSLSMARFCSMNDSLGIGDALKIDVHALAKEVRMRMKERVEEFKKSIHVERSVQPKGSELDTSSVNIIERIPSFLHVGENNGVKFGGTMIGFPNRMSFPLPSVMSYSSDEELSALLLRLAFALPQDKLQIKILDMARFGAVVKSVSRLAGLGVMEIFTNSGDIDGVLGDMESYATDLIREGRFSGAIHDWEEYNRRNADDMLPYRVVAIDSGDAFSDEQFSVLAKLCRRGREIGVCVLIAERCTARMKQNGLEVEAMPREMLPPVSLLERAFLALEEMRSLAEARPPERQTTFRDVHAKHIIWSRSATEGLEATLGFSAEFGPVTLKLGGEVNHVLLGGTTGSGKSNLIHVLIHSLCHAYSPAELRLYLLDYKDGLEFGKYVDGNSVWLPHVESASVHNDPAYALSMFDYIQQECLRRKKAFAGARSYAEFRRSGGRMPRIVIIIDEFHKLFETVDAEGMSARLIQVLKQGRAYGVHLVLATQTLASVDIPNLAGMLGQIPLRLALRGSEDDRILEPDNMAATGISIPTCVFNDQFGRTKGNRLFDVPEAIFDGAFRSDVEAAHRSTEIPRGMGIVFNGTQMPQLAASDFAPIVGDVGGAALQILIGKENAFGGKPIAVLLGNSPTEHVLIAASPGDGPMDDNGNLYRDDVVVALKDDICRSVAVHKDVDVVFYNPQMDFSWSGKSQNLKICPASASDETLRSMLEKLANSSARHRVFMVEAFEHARLLHPIENSGGYMSDGTAEEDSARKIFMSAFSGGVDRLPFNVVLITRNFRYAAGNLFYDPVMGLSLLKMFAHRVAIDLPLDDVQTLFPSCLRRDTATMFYGSTHTDLVQAFLPYAIKEA